MESMLESIDPSVVTGTAPGTPVIITLVNGNHVAGHIREVTEDKVYLVDRDGGVGLIEIAEFKITGAPFSVMTLGINLIFDGFVSDRSAVAAAIMDAIKYHVNTVGLIAEDDDACTKEVRLIAKDIELTHEF